MFALVKDLVYICKLDVRSWKLEVRNNKSIVYSI